MIKQYTKKEKTCSKMNDISRLKGGLTNKGLSTFAKEYQNLTWNTRTTKAALAASDKGRCWWIYDYIVGTTLLPKEAK